MKKLVFAVAALAAFSTGALADRNWDITNPPPGMEFVTKYTANPDRNVIDDQKALVAVQPTAQKTFIYDDGTPSGLNSGSGASQR